MVEPNHGEDGAKPIRVTVFGRTDVGLVREHNEDNFLVADLGRANRTLLPEVRQHTLTEKGTLLAVCDGMGGAAAGEVASQIAADIVYERMQEGEPAEDAEELARRLEAAVIEAGERIFQSAKVDRARRGMGTTITAACLVGQRLVVAQVGDSRGYVLRGDQLVQVTRDQSLVNQLIEAGQLKPEEAELFEHSNIILQALGTSEEVSVDLTYVDLCRGDVLVLCSDGLSGLVPDDEVRKAVLEHKEPIEACKRLTELAREAGGHDNITVIVALFDGEGLPEASKDEPAEFRRLEVEGRKSPATVEPMVPRAISPDEDDDEAAGEKEPESSSQPRSPTAPRAKPRQAGASPTVTLLLGALVLAIGVGLGYLIVVGMVGRQRHDVDASISPETIPCSFTSSVQGARLIVDGQDYLEIPSGGVEISLPPGIYSVEARLGSTVVARRDLELRPGQGRAAIALDPEGPLDAGPEVDSGALADGGESSADTGVAGGETDARPPSFGVTGDAGGRDPGTKTTDVPQPIKRVPRIKSDGGRPPDDNKPPAQLIESNPFE